MLSHLVLRLTALLVLSCASFLPSAGAQPTTATDPIVARVDGYEVRLSELMAIFRNLPQRVQQMPFEQVYRPILEHAIGIRLLAAEGRKQNLQDDSAVKRRLAQLEDQLIYQAYAEKIVNAKATDARLKEAYDKYVKEHKGEEEVRASHILVKTEQEAKEIIARLEKGEDFAKLAKEKSTDPSKAQNSGDLGFFTREQMVKEFADAAYAMKPGEISKAPVKTQFGWHVIRLNEKRTQPAPAFEEVKDQLKQELAQTIAGEEINRLRDGAKIERFDATGAPLKDEAAPDKKN
jgi:peptidyl-prolyl cis-trans isomerase C